MIIKEDQLESVINVIVKLGLKYRIFYVKNVEEADKELPPYDTVYIYIVKS